ncbi:zinc finger, C3HC4 type (RING finger) protein [Babesia caballi]|uniref:Zinc finger, C3HC4 type (RING finger) protein n=1 Tax=Babesia caballi TaxID=5871 RepID=A0AAV4LLG8_BABCB|nr:zinc finger, C3HC4 type (RING finger) protein [Babesia caballi]
MSEVLLWKLKGTSSAFSSSRLVSLPCTVQEAREKLKEECGLQHTSAIEFVLYLAADESQVLPATYVLAGECKVLVSRCVVREARQLMSEAEKRFMSSDPNPDSSPAADGDSTSCSARSSTPVSTPDAAHKPAFTMERPCIPSRPSIDSQPPSSYSETVSSIRGESPSPLPMHDDHDAVGSDDMRHPARPPHTASSRGSASPAFFDVEGSDAYSGPNDMGSPQVPSSLADSDSVVGESDEDSRIQAAMQERDFFGGETGDTLSRRYYRNRTTATTATSSASRGADGASRSSRPAPGAPAFPQAPSYFDPAANDVVPVDISYICHMCGQRGHHIKNCIQLEGKRSHKKIRPATGIPVDFLRVIGEDEINDHDEVYHLKTGQFAVMKDMSKVSGGAFFTKSADQRIQSQLGLSERESKSMARSLRCSVCNNFFNNPVITLCCGESFCLQCIIDPTGGRAKVDLSRVYRCPSCNRELHFSDLQANTCLKNAVDALVLRNDDERRQQGPSDAPSVKRRAVVPSADGKRFVDAEFLTKQKALAAAYLRNRRR